MKNVLLIAALLVFGTSMAQDSENLQLNNAVVIGQMDNVSDRYTVESVLTELFASYGVTSLASLNVIKQGGDAQLLASDSLMEVNKGKGFDTYVLISVRGYDKRYKKSTNNEDFATAMSRANLFDIYQMDIVSVSFEFKFFRNGQLVHNEVIKIGGAGSREKVLRKLRKKVSKRLLKAWKE